MRRYYTTEVLDEVAGEMGANIHFQPDVYQPGGFVTFANGKRAFFLNNQLGANDYGAFSVVNDKHCATALMRHFGYRVPEETLLDSSRPDTEAVVEEGFAFAQALGFPVVVKPRNMSQGHMVSKVHDETEFRDAVGRLLAMRQHALVQRFHPGDDHRIVVFDGEIVVAYVRRPPVVTGDGISTVARLIEGYRARLADAGRNIRIGVEDARVRSAMARAGLQPSSVLAEGRTLRLLDNANMASGGTGVEVTAELHPGYADVCIRLCRDFGLRLGGVDLLTTDITAPVGDYAVLELNATPGIRHFAAMGEAQDRKARALYRRILTGLSEASAR